MLCFQLGLSRGKHIHTVPAPSVVRTNRDHISTVQMCGKHTQSCSTESEQNHCKLMYIGRLLEANALVLSQRLVN